jgi:hypothetical protein
VGKSSLPSSSLPPTPNRETTGHANAGEQVACTAHVTLACLGTAYGDGHHQVDVPLVDLRPALQFNFIETIIYQICLAMTKVSICLFYIRLFGNNRRERMMMYGTMAIICLYFIPCEIMWTMQCNPIAGYYDKTINAVCVRPWVAFLINATMNVLVDIWLIAFIAPRIWKLKMNVRQKVPLLFIVTMGWLVVVASILRTYLISLIWSEPDGTCKGHRFFSPGCFLLFTLRLFLYIVDPALGTSLSFIFLS